MKTLFIPFLAACFFCLTLSGQTKDYPKNNIYFEFGGDALIGSLNYERSLLIGKGFKFNARVGSLPIPIPDEFFLSVLAGGNSIWGKRRHFGELGVSYVILLDSYQNTTFASYRIGYRFEGKDRFLFKAAFTFLNEKYIFDNRDPFLRWFGISFGKVF